MSAIHPSARVHPSAVIEGDVAIGADTVIGPFCYLLGPVRIGASNRISAHVVIGEEPEHKTKSGSGTLWIGDRNVIREHGAIQRGSGEKDTRIGNGCYLMDHVHVAHDCLLENDVTISPNVVLGGHSVVQEGATIGISSMLHQWSVIGAYAMIGMGSVVTKDVAPFSLVMGNPARFSRWNTHVFPKLGMDERSLKIIEGRAASEHAIARALLERFYSIQKRALLELKV